MTARVKQRLRSEFFWLLLAFGSVTSLLSQPANRGIEVEGVTRRSALVVGMAAYPRAPLQNTVNDGRDIAEALQGFGFEVELLLDADQRRLSDSIDRWVGGLKGTETALFFYSGHGIQVDGENFVVPIDFDAKDEADAKHQGYSLDRIHDRMLRAGSPLNILIVDACRNNPFSHTRSTAGGLAPMNAGKGSFIAFATAPGSVASDNPGEKNGLFTKHLLKVWQTPGLDLGQVFDRVRTEVYNESGDRQLPWSASSVIGAFTFHDFNKDQQRLGSLADELKSAEAQLKELERQRQEASRARQAELTKETEAKAMRLRDSLKAKEFEQEQLKQSLERQARIEEERRQLAQQEQQERQDRERRNQEMEARLADVRRQTDVAQRELASLPADGLTLAQARLQVARLRKSNNDVVHRGSASELIAVRNLDRDYDGLRAELRKPVAAKDVFETTAQYESRLRQNEVRKASIESKYQSERAEIQRRYAIDRDSQTVPYTKEITGLISRTYPGPAPKWELLDYNADAASLMMSVNGQPVKFTVPPEDAKAIYTHPNLLRIDMECAYSDSEPPPIAGLVLVHPAFGKLAHYARVNVDQLVDTALRLYAANDFERFPAAAELALKVGGMLTFKLQHHHSSHLHETTLAFSRFRIRFDPQVPESVPGQSGLLLTCTYAAFTTPILDSSLEAGGNPPRQILLTLKVLDAKGKVHTLNFADRSAQMKEAMIPKAGGMIAVSGHIIESRPESYSALTAIAKAFQAAAGLASSSSDAQQRTQ